MNVKSLVTAPGVCALFISLVLVSACSTNTDYLEATSLPPITPPGDLDKDRLGQLYPVPEKAEKTPSKNVSVPFPPTVGVQEDANLASIQTMDEVTWVFNNRAPASTWVQLLSFWQEKKVAITARDLTQASMLTDWFSQSLQPGYQIRYRLRLEQGLQVNTTDIFVENEKRQTPVLSNTNNSDSLERDETNSLGRTNSPELAKTNSLERDQINSLEQDKVDSLEQNAINRSQADAPTSPKLTSDQVHADYIVKQLVESLNEGSAAVGDSFLAATIKLPQKVRLSEFDEEPVLLSVATQSRLDRAFSNALNQEGFILYDHDEPQRVYYFGEQKKGTKRLSGLFDFALGYVFEGSTISFGEQTLEKTLLSLPDEPDVNRLFPDVESRDTTKKLSGKKGYLLVLRSRQEQTAVYIRDSAGRLLPTDEAIALLDTIRLRLI
ncbi:MAG: outer membrane protein assembly factor BamC [Cellvibrionaceae bacterium]